MIIITLTSPWVIDLVLLLRLYAVFPIATTSRRTICIVFGFTFCVKAARLGCDITNTMLWVPSVEQDPLATVYSRSSIYTMHCTLSEAAVAFDLIDHMCVQLDQANAVTQG
jgi:hypothetical protein